MGMIDPEEAYNPSSEHEVNDQGDKVCGVCRGPKPCGCGLDNLDNRPKYRDASAGLMVVEEENIDEQKLAYDRYSSKCFTSGCDILTEEDYFTLVGDITEKSIALAIKLGMEKKVILPEDRLQFAKLNTLRPREYYGLADDILPGLTHFGFICRWLTVHFSGQEILQECALHGDDALSFELITRFSITGNIGLAGLGNKTMTEPVATIEITTIQ